MAKDLFHDTVREALIKDGWTITDDPLMLPFGNRKLYVDLAANRYAAAIQAVISSHQQLAEQAGIQTYETVFDTVRHRYLLIDVGW